MTISDVNTSDAKMRQNPKENINEIQSTQKIKPKAKVKKSLSSACLDLDPVEDDLENEDEKFDDDMDDDSLDDSDCREHSGGSDRVKLLPPSVLKDIEQKNLARKLAGLAPIQVRVRRCLACGSSFQSSGNRTCGCTSRCAGTIAGREII